MEPRDVTRSIDLAVIPGDGIGREVVPEAVETLRAALGADAAITTTNYPFGATHYLESGEILSDDDLAALAAHDAILLGAVGGDPRDPRLAGGIIERGLLLRLRFAFDHYVNLRPTRVFPGVVTMNCEPPAAGCAGGLGAIALEPITTTLAVAALVTPTRSVAATTVLVEVAAKVAGR